MVQIDIPAAFVASMFFLDIGGNTVRRAAAAGGNENSTVYQRFLARSLFFAGAVVAPAGIYLLSGWPGWEQLYWTERVENVIFSVSNALYPAFFVIAIMLAGCIGHVVGYRLLMTGRRSYLRPAYLGVLAAVAILVVLNYPAFLLVGTYRDYHLDRAAMGSVWQNPHGFSEGWLLVMGYFAACLLYVILKVRKESAQAGTATGAEPVR